MPRISSVNKKKAATKKPAQNFFKNRESVALEDDVSVYEKSAELAKKIQDDKQKEINEAVKNAKKDVSKETIVDSSFKKNDKENNTPPITHEKIIQSSPTQETTGTTTDKNADTSADKTADKINTKKAPLPVQSAALTTDTTTDTTTDISADTSTDKTTDTLIDNKAMPQIQSTKLTADSFDTPEQNIHYNQPDLHSEIIDKKNTQLSTVKKSTNTFTLNEVSPQVQSIDLTKDTSADKTTDNPNLIKTTPQTRNTILTTDITADTTTDSSFNNQVFYGQTKDIKNETTDKVGAHPRTELGTYPRTRLDHNNIPERTYSELSKLQQSIIKVIYFSCVQNSGTVSQKISINYLIDQTKSSGESIKRTIRRLIKENFLDKYEWKDGRGGWTKYELHPHVYQSLFGISKLETRDITKDTTTDKLGTYPRTNVPSSSISYNNINKELTTIDQPFNPGDVPGQQQLGPQFDSDWQNIDISPLQSIGFTNHHLSQLFTKNELTPEQVQDSINAFAFDLDENQRGEKIKTSPLNLFMGILKGGSPYNPPKNYESDVDKVLRELMEAERERFEKRQQMQAELKELKYQNWLLDLSVQDKLSILDVPERFFLKMPIEGIETGLKKHFEMKVLRKD